MSEKRFDAKKFLQHKFKATEALQGVLKTKPKQKKAISSRPSYKILIILVIAILIASFIRIFLVQIYTISSDSMEPTLSAGDRVVINKLTYGAANPFWGLSDMKKIFSVFNNPFYGRLRSLSSERYLVRLSRDPRRSDIIALRHRANPDEDPITLVKRIIGLPGETVKIKKGKVYINGRSLKEKHPMHADVSDHDPIRIPYGSYFVLGDNRASSNDSRSWGPLSGNDIIGIYSKRIWHIKR